MVDVKQFVRTLTQSGLMSADEVSAFQQGLPPQRPSQDAQSLAREFVAAGKLTKYQAALIYQGRSKGLVFGEYVVLDKLGQGGMGVVLKARHRTLGRIVAVKVLPAGAMKSPEAVKRFYREVQAAGRLVHANIVTAYDAGENDGIHYLAMAYVEGKDLASVTKERGSLEVKQALDCILQAAKGLAYAHAEGVIHRDIKPSNLLLDKHGTIKILDMGLARINLQTPDSAALEELTRSGEVMGTCHYMAPEQAEDMRHADQRSDIYSLGCTLYRLLAGKPPYDGDTFIKVILAHRDAPVPALQDARPDLPESVEAIFQRMVAKLPEDRYQSMAEVIADIEEHLGSFSRPPVAGLVQEPPSEVLPPSLAFLQDVKPAAAATMQRRGTAADDTLRRAAREATGTRILKALSSTARRQVWTYVGVGGVAALLVVLLGVILTLRTPAGTLVLEVDEPGATVIVDDGKVTLTTPDDKQPVEIQVLEGKHALKVTKGGFETYTEQFTIKSGGKRTVTVQLKRPEVTAASKLPVPQPTERAVARETDPAPPRQPATAPAQAPEQTATTERRLAGILPRPARLPGIGRWQVDTVTPRGFPFPGNCSISWSPDGKLIACATSAGTVRVYEPATLRLVRLLVGHTGAVQSAAWSPDGQRIATAGADNTLRLWSTDGVSAKVLKGHSDCVNCVAWSPDGRRLASASRDTSVRLWDTDGKPGPVLQGHTREVFCVGWSPDGQRLASGSGDGTIRLWKDDGAPGPILTGHADLIWSVAWSPDGQRLASGSHDKTARLWEVDGKEGPVLREHADEVFCVAWSPDSRRLATASIDMTVRLWSADGAPGPVLKGHPDWVRCVAWSPSGSRLASADGQGTVRIWEADGTPGQVLEGDTSGILGVVWSPDCRRFASGGERYSVRIWHSGGTLERTLRGHTGPLFSVAWSPDGQRLASCSQDKTVRLWSADGTPGPVLYGHTDRALSVAWSPDGRSLASSGWDNTVRFWNADGTPGPVQRHEGPTQSVAWSPKGEELASGGWDKAVRLWKADGTPGPVLNGHTSCAACVAWSPDGQRLASGSLDKTVRLWNIDGTPGPVLVGHRDHVISVAWSPDGLRLASGSSDGMLRLWNASGTPGPVLEGNTGPSGVGWSPDGLHVTSSVGSMVISCDANTAEPEWVMLLFNEGRSVKFSAEGRILRGDPKVLEKELIYLVETPTGAVELLKPSEFQKRVAEAAAKAAASSPNYQTVLLGGTRGHGRSVSPVRRGDAL